MTKKNVVILGSTGSIGKSTLKVIDRFPDRFNVIGLTAYNSLSSLESQIKKYKPKYVALNAKGRDYFLRSSLKNSIKILDIETELESLVSFSSVDIVVIGMRGSSALMPFLSAVRASKKVAPANKEALVIAGELIMREARKNNAVVIPVDSEQSAIFQCLQGNDQKNLKRIHLTASGGALRNVPSKEFNRISLAQILNHPRWKMGQKITVDSATLMNKGFEVIEAMNLFNLKIDEINVIIHPEAIIHSMVEYIDGSILAQLSVTDMQLPIQYAMTYPERLPSSLKKLDFLELKRLNFERPNIKKFPALELAFEAARSGGTSPAVLNAADEIAVESFLKKEIKFNQIVKIVEKVLTKHKVIKNPKLNEILSADKWAREESQKMLR